MNREIKFRAWDVENKTMHDIAGFTQFEQYTEIQYGTSGFKKFQPDKIILLQYTSLNDKNGKEIYEGDICRNDGIQMREVVFEDGRYIIRGQAGQDSDLANACWNPNDVEVIGNIYQDRITLKTENKMENLSKKT